MNEIIIKEISENLKIKPAQVEVVLNLLSEGNTIPFIARYRKEVTGALDEEAIKQINEVYEYQVNLLNRKEDVIRLIDEKGLLTDELKNQIMKASKLVEVEDYYRPYKEKKKTKATDAINAGLEPLAKIFMSFPINVSIEDLTKNYMNEKIKTTDEAIEGAKYIIAEWISDNASYRRFIRNHFFYNGILKSKIKKDAVDENKVYEMYYNFSEPIKYAKSYRVLAMNRGEKDKVLTISIDVEEESVINYLESKIIKNNESIVVNYIKEAIIDSYRRLIRPSVMREIRSELNEKSELDAIDNFSSNLEKLLMQPPMKEKMVLALDPAFRTGCKLAVIDYAGRKLEVAVIFPHPPQSKYEESKEVLKKLIAKYSIDIIAIGNGTASRESEALVAEVISEIKEKVEYIIVSEAGASVYSASDLAAAEFPNLDVSERSAISIGRRLQDPLSELVKIDPKSIGVGLYQHDVASKKLSDSLDFVVSKSVNAVGVNVNTASPSLLKYVSGLNKRSIDKILEYRNNNDKIISRDKLLKDKVLTPKAYEQAIGFLRIVDGENVLDVTGIHPESYPVVHKLLEQLSFSTDDIGSEELNQKLVDLNISEYSSLLEIDKYTLEDIVLSLQKPNRDPRDMIEKPLLRSDILKLDDLNIGMMLQGTVRNVAPFGVFIDIGLDNDALAHISRLTNRYIKHPSEVVSVGDIVECYVYEINHDKKQVSLSLTKPDKSN